MSVQNFGTIKVLVLGLPLGSPRKNDAPPSSLMDSIESPKVKIMEGKGIGPCSQARNTSRVEGCFGILRWGLGRLISKSITHMDLHKPNNKLVSA
jgi:hypothetical protein